MSLQEQQNLLARLLTNKKLLGEFTSGAANARQTNGLSEDAAAQLKEIPVAELKKFADSLVHKRFHETEKLLPLTKKALGVDFQRLFREFSADFTPRTVKKHLEDALAFADFLAKKDYEKKWIADLATYERARLDFNAHQKRFVFSRFDHKIAEILNFVSDSKTKSDAPLNRSISCAVWLRIGGAVRHYTL